MSELEKLRALKADSEDLEDKACLYYILKKIYTLVLKLDIIGIVLLLLINKNLLTSIFSSLMCFTLVISLAPLVCSLLEMINDKKLDDIQDKIYTLEDEIKQDKTMARKVIIDSNLVKGNYQEQIFSKVNSLKLVRRKGK